jgi:alpha,alpha-trehalose phosphorylase
MLVKRINRLKPEELLVDESIFALQNGFIGIRGNFAEGYSDNDIKENLINGIYNTYNYIYEENSPMFPQTGQRIINVIDGQTIEIYADNIKIDLTSSKLNTLERILDLESGLYSRKAEYKTPQGLEVMIKEERIVSFVIPELYLVKLTVEPLNRDAEFRIVSHLKLPQSIKMERSDSRIHKPTESQLILRKAEEEQGFMKMIAETTISKLFVGAGALHNQAFDFMVEANGIEARKTVKLDKNTAFTLEKLVFYSDNQEDSEAELQTLFENCKDYSFNTLLELQKQHVQDFWERTKINIYGNDEIDKRVKYNLFQLYSSCPNTHNLSIPAKGLTGEGYEGHYFWDTEIYMIPFFAINHPGKAKKLLMYRYQHLQQAKEEARKHGIDVGAKFPWRTINGYEVSPYFLAGSAQYHINCDIAYAFIKYYQFTGDIDFMINYGFEVILESSRFLYESGNYHDGKFHINNVTGPDEYTTLVNDNYFTNSMTQFQFKFLSEFFHKNKSDLQERIKTLKVDEAEITAFEQAAEKMNLIFDEKLGIFAQDSSFLKKKELDLARLPKEKFPLLLHYHPLFIYRHQVLKQADVLLSLILLDYDDQDIIKKNFEYYLARTTHDSSLSKCIHAIVAYRLGLNDLATDMLENIIAMDFDNTNKNTDHGLHIANSGGIYLAIMLGVFGLEYDEKSIRINPVLPRNMDGIETSITYHENKIDIRLADKIYIKVSKPINLGVYTDTISIDGEYQCDYKQYAN